MRHSPTLAVALSLSACDAGEPPPEPSAASPESIDVWSTSTERSESPPKVPPAAARLAKPDLRNSEARQYTGTMRAYPRWKGERPRARVLDRGRFAISDERAQTELTGAEQQQRDEQLRARELLNLLGEPAR